MTDYITTKEAAQILGTTHIWIARLCREGRLDAKKPNTEWWIDRKSVEDYRSRLEAGEIKPGPKPKE